jgi:sugar lactone lactonase YvrE
MRKTILALSLWVLAFSAFPEEKFLYVVDVGPNRGPPQQVVKYDSNGENPEVFINTHLNRPQDIIFLEDEGAAIVSNLGSNRITKYDAETGAYIGDFATGLGQPTRMEIGPDGLLYVLQWAGNGRVLRFDLNGNMVDEFTSVGVSNGIGLDWDTQGNLYVASFNGTNVRRFDSNGNDQGLFISSNLGGPTNIWFQDNGDLIVLDWNGRSIKRFNSSGNFLGSLAGLAEPEGVEFLDDGSFLVGAGIASSVRQYDVNGNYVGDFVTSGSGGLEKPNGLRFRTVEGGAPEFEINAGLNDAWFNSATPGQGAFITVFPDIGAIFIAVFTYDTERPPQDVTAILGGPGQRWFTAFGNFSGDTAVLDVELTEGGVFDSAEPNPMQTAGYGTVTVVFADCENLLLSYDFPSLGLMGEIPMTRIALDNVPRCEALAAQ